VLSNIDLGQMLEEHRRQGALATLAVQDRKTSRYLLFDSALSLCGRRAGQDGAPELVRQVDRFEARAFSGVHVISARLLSMLSEDGVFSIVTSYLRLAGQGETICEFRADDYYWRDLGRPENIAQAELDLKSELV